MIYWPCHRFSSIVSLPLNWLKIVGDIFYPIYLTVKSVSSKAEAAKAHPLPMLHYENQRGRQWNRLCHHQTDNRQLSYQKPPILPRPCLNLPHVFSFMPARLAQRWRRHRFSSSRFCSRDSCRWCRSTIGHRWLWKVRATFWRRCFPFSWIHNKLRIVPAIRSCWRSRVSKQHSSATLWWLLWWSWGNRG